MLVDRTELFRRFTTHSNLRECIHFVNDHYYEHPMEAETDSTRFGDEYGDVAGRKAIEDAYMRAGGGRNGIVAAWNVIESTGNGEGREA